MQYKNKLALLGIGSAIGVIIILSFIINNPNIDPKSQTTGPINSSIIEGQDIPEPTAYVNDNANILTGVARTNLETTLKNFSDSKKGELAILTVQSLNGLSIEEFGIRVGEKWKVGRKGIDDGVIIIIAINERKVRIEVGRDANITDAQAGEVLNNIMVPKLKNNDWVGAITDGTNALIGLFNK